MVGSDEKTATLLSRARTSRLVRLFFNVLLPRLEWKSAVTLSWMQASVCGFMREAVTHLVHWILARRNAMPPQQEN